MSTASKVDKKIIESKEELVEWFRQGCTPHEKRLIGAEHEKPPFYPDGTPVPFEGTEGRKGVEDFINKMAAEKGWTAGETEHGVIVSLSKNNVSWTFEPGLQMETGGAPLKNCHQIAKETDETITEAAAVCKELGFKMLATGYQPVKHGPDMPFMPKTRYEGLFEWFEDKHFDKAVEVASCTSTVQVNLGFQSEEDMVKMLRVSLALQPIAVALFANSPFADGKPSGYQSYRSHQLFNNLGGRYGFMLPIAFEEDFGFEKFVDYAMNTMPLLGIYKGNLFVDTKGAMFKDFMEGNLEACPGQKATIGDWQNHLNTIWPEVRLRRFLEMRGTDVGPPEMIKALPAFWAGILYDKESLDKAYEMVKDWSNEDRDYLRIMTPQHGLQTPFMNGTTTVQELAKNCLALSEAGLKRRAVLNDKGEDESVYLAPLKEIADTGINWAQRLLELYNGPWKKDISKLYEYMDYEKNPTIFAFRQPQPQAAATQPAAANENAKLAPPNKDFKAG